MLVTGDKLFPLVSPKCSYAYGFATKRYGNVINE